MLPQRGEKKREEGHSPSKPPHLNGYCSHVNPSAGFNARTLQRKHGSRAELCKLLWIVA